MEDAEGAGDMYCFRCSDGDEVTDVWVHVDILWDEFSARLDRRFSRAVFIVYRREADSQEWRVQTEEDFEDMCEYLDDTQIHTLQVELRSTRRGARRPEGTADGGGIGVGASPRNAGLNVPVPAAPGGRPSPLSPANQAQVPRDRLAVRKSQGRLPTRPSTAGARRAGGNPLHGGARPPRAYGALKMPDKKQAWDANVGAERGGASPRVRRHARTAQGNIDKESMQDRILGLQRELNEHEEGKVRLQAETVRLELELVKVLRENEELFKAKGGGGAIKGGVSSNLVHVMKKRIKELEGIASGKDGEMKKLKSDTRVTRLNEMEVEKSTFLHEVRRLQREARSMREQLVAKEGVIKGMAGSEEEGANYRRLYSLYEGLTREHEEAKRKVREVHMAALSGAEERKVQDGANEKLRVALAQARGKATRAAAAAAAAKTGSVVAAGGKGGAGAGNAASKEREEAAHDKVKELLAMQKRLDLALNRSNRERDTAETARDDKEQEVQRLQEQKRALQMQLHSLGAGAGGRGAGGAGGDRSDMICFFVKDADSTHVEVQFVDFRMTFGEFSAIVNRLYRRAGTLAFSYEWQGQKVLANISR
ncbi:hypothetical protein T484DRAFT_3468315 [Baffinella frigidus]|nr:hypothetical protein T484DRAFT_3468315 [Cryptophyta sp. CCMP2293]